MTINDLAIRVLRLLDMQAEYFRERQPSKLSECKDAERRLRADCEELINPTPANLFDGEAP